MKQIESYQNIKDRDPKERDYLLVVNPIGWGLDNVMLGRFLEYYNRGGCDGFLMDRYAKIFNGLDRIEGVGTIPEGNRLQGSSLPLLFEKIYLGPKEIRQAFIDDPVVRNLLFPKIDGGELK